MPSELRVEKIVLSSPEIGKLLNSEQMIEGLVPYAEALASEVEQSSLVAGKEVVIEKDHSLEPRALVKVKVKGADAAFFKQQVLQKIVAANRNNSSGKGKTDG